MVIGQWSRVHISESSPICGAYRIDSGEYLIMYDSSSGELIFKEPDQGEIVLRKQLNSPMDLVLLVPDRERSTIMQQLKTKKYKSAGGGLHNHHIIPHFLCIESQLVVEAEKHGVFSKDGSENLMPLPDWFHKANHTRGSKYAQTVRYYLQDRWNALVEAGLEKDRDEIRDTIFALIAVIREELNDLKESGGSIKDIY